MGVWVWIAGGVIIASLVFLIGYIQLQGVSSVGGKQKVLEAYEGLVTKADRLCTSFKGTRDVHEILLSRDVEYLYSWPNSTLPKNIDSMRANSEITEGSMICIKMEGEKNHCEEVGCNVTMRVMGYSSPDEDLLSLVLDILKPQGSYLSQRVSLERDTDGVECRLVE